MTIKTISQPSFETLVSPGPDRHVPIYNWHAFKHSYSKQLVEKFFVEFKLKKGSWVLDPFCGGGTTLLSCKQSGINAQGFDILPFSVFLSNVKVQDYELRELLNDFLKLQTALKKNKEIRTQLPNDIDLLEKAFPKKVRNELLRIKTCISNIESEKNRNFFNLGFLSTLEVVSNTAKAGGFLRLVDRQILPSAISRIFHDRCATMYADVLKESFVDNGPVGIAKASLGDARRLSTTRAFDAVITSPPYPNRHDYTRIYALEMAFDFISGNDELKKVRYETLRSHVEAREKYSAPDYEEPKEVKRLIAKVKKNGLNNIQVPAMLSGYFEDMYLCLSQMKSKLERKGKIALVVSNVRFSGVNFPVDTILAQIGLDVGLRAPQIWMARKRGNSAQQMRDYDRKTSRESIVIWTN